MREHSVKELTDKLIARNLDAELVAQQVQKFVEKDIQSDFRFAESYIRSKAMKGQGEQRIRLQLNEHQVDDSVITKAFLEAEVDFDDIAAQVYRKKYTGKEIKDWQEKQKRMRFLQYRGFTSAQIQTLIRNVEKNL